MRFEPARRQEARLRLAITGPAGAGKTYTSLVLAKHLAGAGGKVAVIDTERGSAAKYAGEEAHGVSLTFDHLNLNKHNPTAYIEAVSAAAAANYDVLVIDSLSHEWGSVLDEVDRIAKTKTRGNSFRAWGEVTPRHKTMINAILAYPGHVIATMRTKTAYEVTNVGGKAVPKKVGLAPIQREGVDFEFDVVLDMALGAIGHVSKTRCRALHDQTFEHPGAELADVLRAWLTDSPTEKAAVGPEK